jgi:outer membrane protein
LEAQELQSKSNNMSQEKAQEEFEILQQRGQLIGQQLQQQEQQMQRMGQLKMDSVITQVRKTIREYGEANGYRYILTGGEGGSVLYGDKADDITSEILQILNESYK